MFKTIKEIGAIICFVTAFVMFIFDALRSFSLPESEEEMREETKFFLDILILVLIGILLLIL